MRFGAGWLSAGVAALLLTAGCKEGRSLSASERESEQGATSRTVEQAHERADQALEQAEKTQEQASRQQDEASQAQEEVLKARQEMEEAQARAQTEAQQAQQAQQQAQQQTQQTQQTVSEAQASALEAQRQQQTELAQQEQQQAQQDQQQAQQPVAAAPAAAPQAQGEQLIVGEVMTASDREVLVSVGGEPQLRLQVEPGTQVIVDGQQGRAGDIQEGSQVRASYRNQGGEPKAVRIEVTTAQQPVQPTTPESGESPSTGQQPPPFQED